MSDALKAIRDRLDNLDRTIVEALAERESVIGEVIRLKLDGDPIQIRDLQREEDLLSRIVAVGRKAGADTLLLTRIYKEILEQSVRVQQERLVDRDNPTRPSEHLLIAYQGTPGSYSHQASMRHFGARGAEVTLEGHDSFTSMLESVRDGRAHYGVLPIENTTAGSINEAYDLLAAFDLFIVGEEVQVVDHCLIGIEGAALGALRRIYSHPQALLQCSRFIGSLANARAVAHADTAGSCLKIVADGDPAQAAIAAEGAAAIHGLEILKRGVANQRENFTRMVVVAKEQVRVDPRLECKTSIVFATRHEHGALLSALSVLEKYSLNLTKLESRPRPNTPWQYLFYADFEGNIADDAVGAALAELPQHTGYLRVLGCYPSRTGADATPAEARPVLRKPVATGRLVSRRGRPDDSVVSLGRARFGEGRPVVVAGPAAVESEAQLLACARSCKEAGGDALYSEVFRAPDWPGHLKGTGAEGARVLAEAGAAVGLPVATRVRDVEQLAQVVSSVQALVVGGSEMEDEGLLDALGTVDRVVILRRGHTSSMDEWLAAAERILRGGNQQVVLCDAGVRWFGSQARSALDLAAIPVIRERTHLPIVIDPGLASRTWRYVVPQARAALAGGASGVCVAIHPNPHEAAAGGQRSLTFPRWEELMGALATAARGSSGG